MVQAELTSVLGQCSDLICVSLLLGYTKKWSYGVSIILLFLRSLGLRIKVGREEKKKDLDMMHCSCNVSRAKITIRINIVSVSQATMFLIFEKNVCYPNSRKLQAPTVILQLIYFSSSTLKREPLEKFERQELNTR